MLVYKENAMKFQRQNCQYFPNEILLNYFPKIVYSIQVDKIFDISDLTDNKLKRSIMKFVSHFLPLKSIPIHILNKKF